MISGLFTQQDYISKAQELGLIHWIDEQPWRQDLKRRVQHYGYLYDYKARAITQHLKLGPLPQVLHRLANQFVEEGIFECLPDQCIINEYEPGQGISAHTDCIPCFGDIIASISLGSACLMKFSKRHINNSYEIRIARRSLLVLRDEVRYQWMHSIPARKSDTINGIRCTRAYQFRVNSYPAALK